MMFCSNCGSPIPPGQTECTKCRTPAQTVNVNALVPEEHAEELPQLTSTIPLAQRERILWHRDSTHGLIRKEITLEEAVTNMRCLRYDVPSKRIVAQVGIDTLPEVIIMNIHRVNDSIGGGIFLTPRMLGLPGLPLGFYGGPRRGNLKIFGDVSLLVSGNIVMTFENIKDPQGLRQLIQALKRAHLGSMGGRQWAAQRTERPFQRFDRQTGERYPT